MLTVTSVTAKEVLTAISDVQHISAQIKHIWMVLLPTLWVLYKYKAWVSCYSRNYHLSKTFHQPVQNTCLRYEIFTIWLFHFCGELCNLIPALVWFFTCTSAFFFSICYHFRLNLTHNLHLCVQVPHYFWPDY